ncbi:MAG TPA: dienelactone hydrolase family protein [Terriglobales bacterium]
MISTEIEIPTADGVAGGVFIHPEGTGPWPGVLYLTDIGGIRPVYREMVGRLAAKGYAALMPNVFYRTAKPPLLDFKPVIGEERTMKRFAELAGPLTPEAMERDASTYVDTLAANRLVKGGTSENMGVVGHCFTGAMALRAAAARPDKIAAAASFHGGGLYTDKPTSPALVLPRVKAHLYFGHAVQDRSMPPEAIEKLNAALRAWGGKYESEVYDGALHGWTTLDGGAYNQPQAERAFTKLTELFGEALRQREDRRDRA